MLNAKRLIPVNAAQFLSPNHNGRRRKLISWLTDPVASISLERCDTRTELELCVRLDSAENTCAEQGSVGQIKPIMNMKIRIWLVWYIIPFDFPFVFWGQRNCRVPNVYQRE